MLPSTGLKHRTSLVHAQSQKSATTALHPDFHPCKPQDSNTTSRQNTPVIYYYKNRSAYNSHHRHAQKNTEHTTASGKKPPARSNQREARASATQGRPVAACRTNSRRRKANGLAPDICHNKHLKSLTGQTTYATKNKIKTYRITPRQSPTCQAIRALTCCACLLTSLFSTHAPNTCTNYPTVAKKYSPTASTKCEDSRNMTRDSNIGKATTAGAATRDKIGTTGTDKRRLPKTRQ